MASNDKMEKIISLAKRRGFVYQGSEIYGGIAGIYDFGPLGVELLNNLKRLWWEANVYNKDNYYGLDSGMFKNPKVWERAAIPAVSQIHSQNVATAMLASVWTRSWKKSI